MKRLLVFALLSLALTGCYASVAKEPPAPTVVYVRDEAAIAKAHEDGFTGGALLAGVFGASTLAAAGVLWAMRRDEPAQRGRPTPPAQLPPVQHYHYHDNRTVVMESRPDSEGRQRAREMLSDGKGVAK